MSNTRAKLWLPPALAAMMLSAGCGPSGLSVPPIKPEQSAAKALEAYDANGDGLLAASELVGCPALLDGMANIDKDGDNLLSTNELRDRFAMWVQGGIGASPFTCRVKQKGRPLAGAKVRFVPVEFLADAIQPAEGTTNPRGSAKMSIDKSQMPSDLQNLKAVQQGLYRVEINHDSIAIPAKYNTESTLGLEVSFEKGRSFVLYDIES